MVFVFRENLPSHFKVKEYCPLVFRRLREIFGIDDKDYVVSAGFVLLKSQICNERKHFVKHICLLTYLDKLK